MTASTLTVTDFVRARLGEDEATIDDIVEVARAHPWTHEGCAMVHVPAARVLAQCAAMRKIVEIHSDAGDSQGYVPGGYGDMPHACAACGTAGEYGEPWPCETMRALASIWSSHPDWREEWR